MISKYIAKKLYIGTKDQTELLCINKTKISTCYFNPTLICKKNDNIMYIC